jgi:hypothetical protein
VAVTMVASHGVRHERCYSFCTGGTLTDINRICCLTSAHWLGPRVLETKLLGSAARAGASPGRRRGGAQAGPCRGAEVPASLGRPCRSSEVPKSLGGLGSTAPERRSGGAISFRDDDLT